MFTATHNQGNPGDFDAWQILNWQWRLFIAWTVYRFVSVIVSVTVHICPEFLKWIGFVYNKLFVSSFLCCFFFLCFFFVF